MIDEETTVTGPAAQAVTKRWTAGMRSPNPRGRPKRAFAIAELVRDVADPELLLELLYDIARGLPAVQDLQHLREVARAQREGKTPPPLEGVGVEWPSTAERLAAIAQLLDRGWGKPETKVTIGREFGDGAEGPDFSRFSEAELDAYLALSAKLAGKAPLPGAAPALASESEAQPALIAPTFPDE